MGIIYWRHLPSNDILRKINNFDRIWEGGVGGGGGYGEGSRQENLLVPLHNSASSFIFRAKKNTWTKRIERIESQPPHLEQEKSRLPNPSRILFANTLSR
jgi:hypothetical protein